MEAQIRILENAKERIVKAQINFKKSLKERLTEAYINARLESLETQFSDFTSKHENLIGTYSVSELKATCYINNDVYEDVYDVYLNYKVDLKNALPKVSQRFNVSNSDVSSDPSQIHSLARLPKITIPTFSGNYTEWLSFRDLFLSLVHNNKNLEDVQRLHYLRAQLSGEAEQLVRHIPITQANYEKCWNMLNARYNNKRFLANCVLKRMLNQRSVTSESSCAYKELLDTTTDCLHELSNLGINIESWDIIVIYLIGSKLDVESRKQWELSVSQSIDDIPSFKAFQSFLETRYRALEFVEPKGKPRNVQTVSNPKVLHIASKMVCPHCSDEHKLCHCKGFANVSVDQRRSLVKSLGLCFNCFGAHHRSVNCRVFTKCHICKRKHHTLLHSNTQTNNDTTPHNEPSTSNDTPQTTPTQNVPTSHVSTHLATNLETQVLLATAVVKAESRNGYPQMFRALLDQGSQASFITEAAVQLLQLKKIAVTTAISGLGGNNVDIMSKHSVIVNIQSLHDPSFNLQVKAYVLSKVTSVLPERRFTLVDWPELNTLELADPHFNKPNKIDMLLGSDVYSKVLKGGLIKDPLGVKIAQDTYLGWIVSGGVTSQDRLQACHNVVVSMHTRVEEMEILKKFWEIEADPIDKGTPHITPEERACEEHFAATTQRDANGRYVVRLPFRHENAPHKPTKTRDIAIKRLHGLERKLSKNPELKRQYSQVINEYLSLGHMERISNEEDRTNEDVVYLSHHAVIRDDRTTTKVRVVFDASCKGANGTSLNAMLMVGPTLQDCLRHLVMRWRQHPVCLVADIVKMYRQVKVAEDQVDFQRILWREDECSEIQDYRLLRVTFGTSCAPYLAVKALQQTSRDEGHKYPLAARPVLKDFYIDDVMTGCQSETEALKLYQELNELLKTTGFTLQKWTSNKKDLLIKIEEKTGRDLEIKEDEITKILGLTWNRMSDEFQYKVNLPSSSSVSPNPLPHSSPATETKRTIISEICRLFDPLGWIAPCIVTAKVFIQRLWIAGLDWDDELPPELLKEWKTYRSELHKLEQYRIPRWIERRNNDRTVELHGFSDASSKAYAAVIYIRVIDSQGTIYSNLVTAKTKVAPIKQISIPRLELCGAVLVAKLLKEVGTVLDIPKDNWHAWTDSMVVLAWISDYPCRWKTFVANRTSEILSTLDSSQWHHVQSTDNPADSASRGLSPTAFLDDPLWKGGPSWLVGESISYPKTNPKSTSLEQRQVKVHTTEIREGPFEDLCSRFSSLRRLVRVTAFCRRFLNLKKPRESRAPTTSYLTAMELHDSMECCLRQSQKAWFKNEIKDLQTGKNCNKSSGLASLTPFIDDNDLVRVGGRIQNSQLSDEMKHPFLVPHTSRLAKLIVADAHERVLHGGQQLTLNFLRTKYWIPRVKNLVRTYIHNCVRCIRYSGAVNQPMMGQLPSCRVTPSKPFSHCGVDYAGPIQMRTTKGRGHKAYKGYICLFICMATRAIHLEAVSDLTSQGFLAAFRRFVARRGRCTQLWSDNGTNFVGASKEINALFQGEQSIFQKDIASVLANHGTEWQFIPPHSPNFGGLWESGIKSTKHHLKRVIGELTLTFEEMSTVLCQIEACLNSRPLSQASSDPENMTPLTPGHFLVGEPLVLPPDNTYEFSQMTTLRRWQLTQRIVQDFWRRWSNEYLTLFHQRHKWTERTRGPQINDVVFVKEDNLPPAKWLYGRVVALHPGKDGVLRVVTLKCNGHEIKRPVSKLCPLPIYD